MAGEQKEYVVRVPSSDTKKQFNVMRFSAALNVDVTKFKNCKLEREILFKEPKEYQEEELPEFGAGSEYGRKEKEEARRRKFEKRKNKQNNSPWILKVGGKHGKKYRGIREGGVTENASYYVFFQASDGMFEAFPVNEWYNFTPFQRYKALSAEEAEEKFTKRDQILNFFQLRNMAKHKGEGDKDESLKITNRKVKKEFKVSDMDDWDDMSENELSGDSEEDAKQRKVRKEKKKIKKSDSDEEEPLEDSDEGDYDDKEVDYMSDKSSSSEPEEERVNLKGVEDESALRDLVVSDDEEEEEENKNENPEPNEDQSKNEMDKNLKQNKNEKKSGTDSFSESDFDSENSDLEESKSALLIQKSQFKNLKLKQEPLESSKFCESPKRKLDDLSSSNIVSLKDNNNKSNGLKMKFKQKIENSINEHSNKKLKVKHDNGITEEAVRRYLTRKPMTAADLVQKFKNKTAKKELPDLLSEILRKLNPEKQNIKGKLYFSLKPT